MPYMLSSSGDILVGKRKDKYTKRQKDMLHRHYQTMEFPEEKLEK